MKTLSEIAKNFKTDKGVGFHDYTEVYNDYLFPYIAAKINLLEIGVFEGESLKMWESFLSEATIIGLDINPDCIKYAGGRKKVYIGSQTDSITLWKLEKENHPLSVIIDDGSHNWNDQIKTFNIAFPMLKPGGLYFIEDLHTSYVSNGPWGNRDAGVETGVDFTKTFVDDVMLRGKSFMGYQELAGRELSYNEHYFEYVHFYRSLCVVKKREIAL